MATDFLRGLLSVPLLGLGLFAPGWLLARALRTPAGPLVAFLGSAALLFNLVLVLDALGLTLDLLHLGAGLALLCLALALPAARASAVGRALRPPSAPPFRWQSHHWFFLPAALGFAAFALRATLDPLSGFDTVFRWDFLAQQILRTGHLAFYPPVTSADFLLYGWPDGIAPLVSGLALWSYLSAGHAAASATVPLVLTQGALLFLAVGQLAAGSARTAAPLACALLATSGVLLWGVAMGQETGLTALTLVALFLFLARHRAAPEARWLVWAGLAAGVGALAREYGLAWIALGALTLAWWRVPRRGWLEFTLAAAVVALPWYLRNWAKTGNPLYSHSLGGRLPGNPVLDDYNTIVSAQLGLGSPDSPWPMHPPLFLVLVGVPLVLGLLAGLRLWRTHGPWLVALLAVVGLWIWSIGQTAGGLGYSLRVLTPALALGAALAACWLAPLLASRFRTVLLALLTVVALDAGVRSLYLPVEAEVAWWRRAPGDWRAFGAGATRWRAHVNWAALADAADGQPIFVPDPTAHALLAARGARPIPPFSPAVRFLYGPATVPAECFARLRAGRVRFILLTQHSTINDLQAARHPFFRALRATPPTATISQYFVYDLASPDFRLATLLPIATP